MFRFRDFLEERAIDPEELAHRAAAMFGKKKSYGKWLKAEKGKHIPLTNYNAREADSAARKHESIQSKLGMNISPGDDRFARSKAAYEKLYSRKLMPIKDLHATQPFVRTEDPEKLKAKLAETNPKHIKVVTHRGKHFVVDGHHAIMAAHLRGEKHVEVNHMNMDHIVRH